MGTSGLEGREVKGLASGRLYVMPSILGEGSTAMLSSAALAVLGYRIPEMLVPAWLRGGGAAVTAAIVGLSAGPLVALVLSPLLCSLRALLARPIGRERSVEGALIVGGAGAARRAALQGFALVLPQRRGPSDTIVFGSDADRVAVEAAASGGERHCLRFRVRASRIGVLLAAVPAVTTLSWLSVLWTAGNAHNLLLVPAVALLTPLVVFAGWVGNMAPYSYFDIEADGMSLGKRWVPFDAGHEVVRQGGALQVAFGPSLGSRGGRWVLRAGSGLLEGFQLDIIEAAIGQRARASDEARRLRTEGYR